MCCNPNSYDESNPLLGVILCGGSSSRMGEDKGLMLQSDQHWVEVSLEKLERLGVSVVISINSSQEEAYLNLFSKESLVLDKIGLKGPLEGILSVHDHFPSYDLIVIATDLPDLSINTLKELVNIYDERSGEHDFFVYKINDDLEPLVGVYTAEGLNKIFSLHLSNQLEKHSMKHILDLGNTFSIELPVNKISELKNYNQRSDLSK